MKSAICLLFVVASFCTVPIVLGQSPTPLQAPLFSTEDLFTPSISSSHLTAAEPELEQVDDETEFTAEWWTVRWRPDDPIYLYVVRPKGTKNPPVVIYLYDYLADTDIFRDDDWRRRVTAGGYAAVGFVPALTGQRFHDRPLKQWFVSEMQEALAKSAHDLEMVLNYLSKRGDVNTNEAGVYGVGAGATIAVMAASVDPRIKAVDLVNPWGDWPAWLSKSNIIPEEQRRTYLNPDFLKKIAGFDPVMLLPDLKRTYVLLDQCASNTGAVPKDAQEKIKAALQQSAPPSRSSFVISDDVPPEGREFDWIKQQLKPSISKAPLVPEAHQGSISAVSSSRKVP